jgi:hypothetical protein
MKKSTLFVLLAAILLGAAAYYFDWKRGEKEAAKSSEDATKLAFNIQPDEIQSLTIAYPADPKSQAVTFEKRGGSWQITKPLQTDADQASVEGISQGISSARVAQTEPGAPDRLKAYGLDPPAVGIDFQLKSGAKHSVELGKKDFLGSSVYAIVDHGKDVALLPESLLVSSDKPLQVLRDQNVLHVNTSDVRSFDLKNAAGEIAATKDKTGWNFSKPAGGAADADAVNSILTATATAKLVSVESETAENLARYGLASPAITVTEVEGGGKNSTLQIGKQDGDEYFARDTARPTIFRISQDLYKKLSQTYPELRDKKIARFDPAAITHVEIHNATGTIICTRKNEEEWIFNEPADQKGKSASLEKLFTTFDQARAEQIIDHPTPEVTARFAKPAFDATLTAQDGKKLIIDVSKEAGDFVYARSSEAAEVYKLKKQVLASLNFQSSDLAF